jgi:hypothetical protein
MPPCALSVVPRCFRDAAGTPAAPGRGHKPRRSREIACDDEERSRASATFRVLLSAKTSGATASDSCAGSVRRARSHWFLWSLGCQAAERRTTLPRGGHRGDPQADVQRLRSAARRRRRGCRQARALDRLSQPSAAVRRARMAAHFAARSWDLASTDHTTTSTGPRRGRPCCSPATSSRLFRSATSQSGSMWFDEASEASNTSLALSRWATAY